MNYCQLHNNGSLQLFITHDDVVGNVMSEGPFLLYLLLISFCLDIRPQDLLLTISCKCFFYFLTCTSIRGGPIWLSGCFIPAVQSWISWGIFGNPRFL